MKKMFGSFQSTLFSVSFFLISLVLLSSCNKDKVTPVNNNDYTGILAVNLSPDKSAVGFAVGGSSFTYNPLSYTSYTGGYQAIYPGLRTVTAYDFSTNASIATTDYNFAAKKYYSAYLLGRNGVYQTVVSDDSLDSLSAGTGKAYIRYVNGIADSAKPTVKIASTESETFNEQAPFASVSAFKSITPGSVTINANVGSTINTSRTITTEANKVYTVLFVGVPGSGGDDSVQVKFIQNGTLQ